MSTASVHTLPLSPANALGLWLQKGLKSLRTAAAPMRAASSSAVWARPSSAHRQEAEKLRALARDMMRMDAGSAADMFAAADRHEFGNHR